MPSLIVLSRCVLVAAVIGVMGAGCSEQGASTQTTPPVQQQSSAPAEVSSNLDEIFDASVQGEIIEVPAQLVNKGGALTDDERNLINKLMKVGVQQDDTLRFKISAFKLSPEPTPPEEIDRVLDNLLKLTTNMHTLSNAVHTHVGPITTWGYLDALPGSELDTGVTNLAKRMAANPGCVDLNEEGHISPAFWFDYNLAKIESGELPCGEISAMFDESNWQQQIERVSRLKKYVGDEKHPFVHFELVNKFAQDCESPQHSQLASFLGVCAWHTKPLDSQALERSLASEKSKFRLFPILVKEAGPEDQAEKIIRGLAHDKVGGSVEDALAELNQYGPIFFGNSPVYWIDKENTKLVIRVSKASEQTYAQPDRLAQASSVLLVVTKTDSQLIVGPGQYGQYDDGVIEAISDRDRDGNVEVWISAEWGECDCEDCRPGVDCAVATHFMAEQFGSDLGGFVQGVAKHDEPQELLNDPRYCPVMATEHAITKCAKVVTSEKENEELHRQLDELQKQGVGRGRPSVPAPALTDSEFKAKEREFRKDRPSEPMTMAELQERTERKNAESVAALTKLLGKAEQDCGGKLAHIPAIGMTDEYFRVCTYHARWGGIEQVVVGQSGAMPLRLYVFNKQAHPNKVYSVNGVITAIRQ